MSTVVTNWYIITWLFVNHYKLLYIEVIHVDDYYQSFIVENIVAFSCIIGIYYIGTDYMLIIFKYSFKFVAAFLYILYTHVTFRPETTICRL